MKQTQFDDDEEPDFDGAAAAMPPHIEHLSRKWAEELEEERLVRPLRRHGTRRRIEDWREERALLRELDDDYDLD